MKLKHKVRDQVIKSRVPVIRVRTRRGRRGGGVDMGSGRGRVGLGTEMGDWGTFF